METSLLIQWILVIAAAILAFVSMVSDDSPGFSVPLGVLCLAVAFAIGLS